MSFKLLSDVDLVFKIKSLVGEEKLIIQNILESLAEIERRRLFATRGYSSLFEFCVTELGYSESSAQRRIASMRLIKILPEAGEKLIAGKVNLSTLSQLQTFIKKEETIKQHKLDHKSKLDLLAIIENKSQRECEKEFVKISPETIRTKEAIREVSADFVEIKFIASKELETKLSTLKHLLAHRNKTNSTQELIEILADMTLLKLEPKKMEPKCTSAAEVSANTLMPQKALSLADIKRRVWARDRGECQFEDSLTNRKCKTKHKVQIDHIYPKALGGEDSLENLRLLCATHNQLAAIQAFSQKHMARFVSDLK